MTANNSWTVPGERPWRGTQGATAASAAQAPLSLPRRPRGPPDIVLSGPPGRSVRKLRGCRRPVATSRYCAVP